MGVIKKRKKYRKIVKLQFKKSNLARKNVYFIKRKASFLNFNTFFGSFIKKGVRPYKMYHYVLWKTRMITGKSVLFLYRFALELLRPVIYYKPRRFGAFIYLIPRIITKKLGYTLAKSYLLRSIRKRKEFFMGDRIINEILDVISIKSDAFREKKDVYEEVYENRILLKRKRGRRAF